MRRCFKSQGRSGGDRWEEIWVRTEEGGERALRIACDLSDSVSGEGRKVVSDDAHKA